VENDLAVECTLVRRRFFNGQEQRREVEDLGGEKPAAGLKEVAHGCCLAPFVDKVFAARAEKGGLEKRVSR
jgi:hypothetical protein